MLVAAAGDDTVSPDPGLSVSLLGSATVPRSQRGLPYLLLLETILQCPCLFVSFALDAKSRKETSNSLSLGQVPMLPYLPGELEKLAFSASKGGGAAGFIRWKGHLDPQKSNRQKTKLPTGPFRQPPHPELAVIFFRVEVDASSGAWSLSLFGFVIVTTNKIPQMVIPSIWRTATLGDLVFRK